MANKITTYMSKELNKPVSNTDLLNLIREYGSDEYKATIPEFSPKAKINHKNIPYSDFEVVQNEFFSILINRIGSTVIKALMYENPLGVFRSELFEQGSTLQEIYVGLADEENYDAKSNVSPFKFADTDIRVFYHDINREKVYTRTINKAWTVKAFTSDLAFDEFINKMFDSLIASDTVDEFEKVKEVLTASLSEVTVKDKQGNNQVVTVKSTEIDTNADDYILEFNKKLIKQSNLFNVPSRTRFENAIGVPMVTPVEEQYLIISADFSSELDSLLANAFNIDKATVLARKIVIDEFPTFTGGGKHQGAKPIAMLVSSKSIILKDKLIQLTHQYNAKTLSFNYFYHHQELVSFSLIENMHVFYTKE